MMSIDFTVVGAIVCAVLVAVSVFSYKIGYQLGSHAAAFAENKLGKDMFEVNVQWGAQIAQYYPNASLGEIPDLVRRHKDQASRLSMDELAAVRRADRSKYCAGK